MQIKKTFTTGLILIALIAVPFWYFMTNFYPSMQNNYLYLGIAAVLLIVIAVKGARFAVSRKG